MLNMHGKMLRERERERERAPSFNFCNAANSSSRFLRFKN